MENDYVPEIYVGENGNWFVNGYDTGTKAQGEPGKDGITPHIGENGNWFIGETDTLVSAVGSKGDKGDVGPQGPAGADASVDIANNLTTTESGKVLDASQGKILSEEIVNLNNNLRPQFIKTQLENRTVSSGNAVTLYTYTATKDCYIQANASLGYGYNTTGYRQIRMDIGDYTKQGGYARTMVPTVTTNNAGTFLSVSGTGLVHANEIVKVVAAHTAGVPLVLSGIHIELLIFPA